ncbi:MAG: glycosyltransferase [Saprospirales bacterium]|nr:MAG: glycosyltransferase [Saprospirales bacterium]
MDLSIVIPLFNEEESLPELMRWIDEVLASTQLKYEVIMVDDGSSDKSWIVIQELVKKYSCLKAIRFRTNYGKSAGLQKGFEATSGNVIITMDADLQDSPEEIPELYSMIMDDGYDLVSGWKKKRYDPITKTIPTKLFNLTTRIISGVKLNDINCGLKAYQKDVVKNIEVYGEMHRYIPVIAKWAGFGKIGEKVVQHQARKYGKTKFGPERFINGFLDLLSITLVGKFGKKPMHFFGSLGMIFFVTGFLILAYLSFLKFVYDMTQMTGRPLFFYGLLFFIFGAQLFTTGFLAEMVSRNSPKRNAYSVREKINFDDEN